MFTGIFYLCYYKGDFFAKSDLVPVLSDESIPYHNRCGEYYHCHNCNTNKMRHDTDEVTYAIPEPEEEFIHVVVGRVAGIEFIPVAADELF